MTAPVAPHPELIGIFETEVREGVGTLHGHLLQIEQHAPDSSHRLEDMLRLAHDLKGSARVVQYDGVARLAHALEHELLGWRRRDDIGSSAIDRALRACDTLLELTLEPRNAEVVSRAEVQTAALDGPAAAPRPTSPASPASLTSPASAASHASAASMPGGTRHATPAMPAGSAGSADAASPAPGPAASATSAPATTALAGTMAPGPAEPAAADGRSSLLPSGQQAAAEPQPAAAYPGVAPRGETLRIARASIDAVAEDVAMTLSSNQRASERAEELTTALSALADVRLPATGASARDIARFNGQYSALLSRMRAAANELRESLRQSWGNVRSLDDHARALCLVPLTPLAVHLERVVRDAAVALGRRVELVIAGRDLHVDMQVIEALKAPLTHALRNAVDHGLESPEERLAAGKPAAGSLRLSFAEEGDQLLVSVEDDGRGIDCEAVRRRLGERALGADDRQVLALLLRSGLSTRDKVTQLSGRGLGLGTLVVVTEQLRGDVKLGSVRGAGTTLQLKLPLWLSLIDGLVVEAGGGTFVLPVSALASGEGDASLSTSLAGLLGLSGSSRPAHVVCLHGRDRSVSIAVDSVRERVEVVRRSVGAHLGRVPFVEGATILHGGEPAFILDARELAEACGGTLVHASHAAAANAPRVLLVDDSATLRATLQRSLVAAGYEVVLAEDGVLALERLATQRCDAIVTDVQMPRHDGFQILARMATRLPVILITAYPDEVAAQRARELGAAAYITKDSHLAERVLDALRSALALHQEPVP
ncbi:MAG TPA: response regulator [Planctomycetota bacterium]|nr:response regulator [Planctomycetota bacterium]